MASSPDGPAAAARLAAEEALELVLADPDRARRAAQEAVAGAAGDPVALAVAERALGLAHRELYDLDASTVHLQRAVDVAAANGLRALAGAARLSLCGNLAEAGRFDDALELAELAAADLDGHQAARARVQTGTIHMVRGDWHEAAARFDAGLPDMEAAGDQLGMAVVHMNRGYTRLQLGDLRRAAEDLERARDLYAGLGNRRRVADAVQHLGLAATLLGDLPRALALFDDGDARFAELGVVDAKGLLHRARALLAARLIAEAGAAIGAARREFAATGLDASAVDALLIQADIELAAGDPSAALESIAAARRRVAEQRRAVYRHYADYAELRARAAMGRAGRELLRLARTTADRLDAAGLPVEGADARLLAARLAAGRGDVAGAWAELGRAGWARRRGPAWLQIAAWRAEAAVRLAEGDTTGARSALRAGLRRVDRHQATLGASDLRARAAELGADLAAAGLGLALGRRRAADTFGWAEQLRANSLELHPTRPPADERVGRALAELRAVTAQGPGDGARGRRDRQQALETEITTLLRHGAPARRLIPPKVDLATVRAALDGAVLVEYVEHGGRLHAVVATSRRSRLVTLGDAAEMPDLVARLRLAASRLARPHRAGGRPEAEALYESTVAALDATLLAPLGAAGGGTVVVVPTGTLHLVPWAALPSLAGRPVTVAPSAGSWLRSGSATAATRVVLAAGPQLDHAVEEVEAIAAGYGRPVVLTGDAATAPALLDAMDGAALVHLAAHGRFRHDNPLFSALVLAGGNVHLCDIERLDAAPGTVVLSACEAALAGRYAGDELMGLAAAFLGLGTRTVVASTLPVSDRETRRLMVRFHELVVSGLPPAGALAAAQAEMAEDSVAARVTAGSFMCLGRR